jgi:hypothetical protein
LFEHSKAEQELVVVIPPTSMTGNEVQNGGIGQEPIHLRVRILEELA